MNRLALLVSLAAATTFAQTKMKAGLWEVKTVKHVADGRDMQAQLAAQQEQVAAAQKQMAEAMAQMSPEQRKQMEAAMAGRGMNPALAAAMKPGAAGLGQGSEAGTIRICFSEAMVSKDKPMVDPEAKCEPTKLNRAGNKMTFEFNCSRDGRTTSGKGENVFSGDTVRGTLDMQSTDAQGSHTLQRETVMTFVGKDCGDVKPFDKLAEELKAKP